MIEIVIKKKTQTLIFFSKMNFSTTKLYDVLVKISYTVYIVG